LNSRQNRIETFVWYFDNMAKLLKFKQRASASNSLYALGLASSVILGFFGGTYLFDHRQTLLETKDQVVQVARKTTNDLVRAATVCNIKGNISIRTGEKIYHVPGQKYYAVTKITPRYGERYFCSQSDAIAAGWRRSKI
jgi:hypothetical protein